MPTPFSTLVKQQRRIKKEIEDNLAIRVIEQHLEVKYGHLIADYKGPLGDSDFDIYYSIDFKEPNKYSDGHPGWTSINISFELMDECNIEKIIKVIEYQLKDHLPCIDENTTESN